MNELVRDLLALIGLALVGVGLWLVHPAASLVTIGALLFVAAALARTRGPDRRT